MLLLKQLTPNVSNRIGNKIAKSLATRKMPAITNFELFLTDDCCCSCDYCFVGHASTSTAMTWDVARRAVDLLIKQSKSHKEIKILFFGGEPLLCFDLIKLIVEYSTAICQRIDKSVKFDMTTNGILFTEDMLAYFKQKSIKFLVSIDGDKDTHDRHRKLKNGSGSFDHVIAKIPLMKEYQRWMGARLTIHPDCVTRVSDNVRYLFEMGINQFIIAPVTGITWNREAVNEYKKQLLRLAEFHAELQKQKIPFRMTNFEKKELTMKYVGIWGCRAGRNTLSIAPSGDIYPCSKFYDANSPDTTWCLGNVFDGISKVALWKELVMQPTSRRQECVKCNYSDYCSGGCPAVNYRETGSIFKPTKSECQFTRIYYEVRSKILDIQKKYGFKDGIDI